MSEDDLDAEMAGAWGRHRMTERQVIAHCASCSARLGMGRAGSTVTLSPRDSALLTLGEAYAAFNEAIQQDFVDEEGFTFDLRREDLNAALAALRKIEEGK